MTALPLDLVIEAGSTWSHGIYPTVNGQPLLEDSWTAKAQVRAHLSSDEVLFEWSTAAGNASISAGKAVILTVSAEVSSAWPWKAGLYDLEVSSPDGSITHRIAQGKVSVLSEITRD